MSEPAIVALGGEVLSISLAPAGSRTAGVVGRTGGWRCLRARGERSGDGDDDSEEEQRGGDEAVEARRW